MSGTSPPPSPERTRLTAVLRELRASTGLSLAGLAERTAYSKSSWERYLNGKALPPRRAVQDLCRLAREPDGRCLALWEIAEAEWSGRGAPPRDGGRAAPGRAPSRRTPGPAPPPSPAPAPASEPDPAPGPPPWEDESRAGGRGTAVTALLVSVCALVAGGAATAALLLTSPDGGSRTSSASSPAPSAASPSAPGPRCRGAACEGQNPMHMVCGGAPDTLAAHRTATGARLELRYSRECGAGWARMWDTRIGDRLEVTAGGPTHDVEIEDSLDAQAYIHTTMAATRPGSVLHACFRPAADGTPECFDARVGRAPEP
ncbi:helix-turn-helix domain-containing protein [Streptomyces poriticola]|uniref:helix-turn-helix domain-containing protein n=1 Tax=Streptomyces poriticola TaxID=3120506 RepID=UPI002FCE0115